MGRVEWVWKRCASACAQLQSTVRAIMAAATPAPMRQSSRVRAVEKAESSLDVGGSRLPSRPQQQQQQEQQPQKAPQGSVSAHHYDKTRARAGAAVAVAVALVVAVVARLDRLDRLGPLAGLNFQPQPHPIAPLGRVLADWPKDVGGGGSLSRASVGFGGGPGAVMGPESLEFDAAGVGPYTGVADGRVVRWKDGRWETFATVSPAWNESCTRLLSPRPQDARLSDELRCGRPLGLKFDTHGRLYIADAYLGLHSVGPAGGLAHPVPVAPPPAPAGPAGPPPLFANDVAVHPNGSVFFTDSSRRWRRQQYVMLFLDGDSTGRLLRYDPPGTDGSSGGGAGATHVVLEGLNFPNGVALAADASFLLLAETVNARLLRLPLLEHGGGTGTGGVEVVADLAGYPDNVRLVDGDHAGTGTPNTNTNTSSSSRFWVAINGPRTALQEAGSRRPWLKKLAFKLPLPLKASVWLWRPWPRPYASAALLEVAATGPARVLRVLDDRTGKVVRSVSEVHERDGTLWMGSVAHNQIATLDLSTLH